MKVKFAYFYNSKTGLGACADVFLSFPNWEQSLSFCKTYFKDVRDALPRMSCRYGALGGGSGGSSTADSAMEGAVLVILCLL